MRLLLLLCFCVLPTIAAGAINKADAEYLCAIQSSAHQTWVPKDYPTVRAHVEEFLGKTTLRMTDVLFCQSKERWANPAWSLLLKRKKGQVIIIGVSRNFVVSDEQMRAWMAHEVAHWIPNNDGGACQAFRLSGKIADDLYCEHAVDHMAASWVGKPTMLLALNGIRPYLERRMRNSGKKSMQAVLDNLARRILLLEESK